MNSIYRTRSSLHVLLIILIQLTRSRFSMNSEAGTSELPETIEEIFLHYYTHSERVKLYYKLGFLHTNV